MAKVQMHEIKDTQNSLLPENTILDQYSKIRNRFHQGSIPDITPTLEPMVDHHGFFVGGSEQLTTRIGGLDKLFWTLIQGVVDDPDYAVKKDSRIYERMARDPQIWYCLNVRKLATASLPWIVQPPPLKTKDATAQKLAAETTKRLEKIPNIDTLFDNILDGLLPGLSINELVWKLEDNKYIISSHYPMNKDRFKFDKDGKLRMLDKSNPVYGKPMPDYKFIAQAFHIRDGSWHKPEESGYLYYGRGLADTPLYHYFYFKLTGLKFYLQSLERFGTPAKILYTGKGQNVALAQKIHEIMLALKQDSVVTIPDSPENVKVDILKSGNTAGMRNMFIEFIRYVDLLITRVILGQELMTEMSTTHGAYAAAQVHKSVFNWLATSDRMHLVETLNRTLIRYDAELNTPGIPQDLRPVFDFKPSTVEDVVPFLQSVSTAQSIGLKVSERQVRELTGLREPLEGETILEAPNVMDMGMGMGNENVGGGSGRTFPPNKREKPGGNGETKKKSNRIDQPSKQDKRRIIGKR